MTEQHTSASGVSRRSVIKAAAWSAPVIAAAVAAPLAAASTGDPIFSIAWTASQTALQTFPILEGGGTLTSQALVTAPTQLTLSNTGRAIDEQAIVQVSVGRPPGINIPVGRARGFGVSAFNGTPATAGARTSVYQSAPIIGQFGFPSTTFGATTAVHAGATNGSMTIPLQWGLAGVSTGVSISVLATFPVVVNITVAGVTATASANITVPVGAGIL